MARKKITRTTKEKDRSRQKKRRYKTPIGNRSRERILTQLYQAQTPLGTSELLDVLGLPSSTRVSLEQELENLCYDGDLHRNSKKTYSLHKACNFAEATIEKTPRGFGFATDLVFNQKPPDFKKDPFISAANMNSAQHGDRVFLRITKIRRDGRAEAQVLGVLRRAYDRLAGFYRSNQRYGVVHPEDPRFPFSIDITHPTNATKIKDGDAVIVSLTEPSDFSGSPKGTIVSILGDPSCADVQSELVVAKHQIVNTFSAEAEAEARAARVLVDLQKYEDFRDLMHVTIDGADAQDFDDAICVEKKRTGFRLFVSIADVSNYVQPGSRLDQEAYERGTSVYFPGRVIPMLPEHLSNNICSLIPGEDRLTLTAILDYDHTGTLQNKRFCRSVIKSHHRFTYDVVKQIIIDKLPAVRRTHKPFLTPLKWAAELAELLQRRRIDKGAIKFSVPEAMISLNDDGSVTSIKRKETHFAHQLIEEFMLAANEAVADTFIDANQPSLYRIHEKPDPEKVSDFMKFAQTLGINLPQSLRTPYWYNEIIDTVAGTPQEYIINNLLLRTMQQARYSSENSGHFGLALENYLHFTSPIRRYPDLIAHRQLCALIDTGKPSNEHKISPAPLKEAGPFLSAKERTAIAAERDIQERLKVQFMANRQGEHFKAIISGVSSTSIYIELLDTFISGTINLSTIKDDYYIFDEKRYRLVGDITCSTLTIGDTIDVELCDIDKNRNKIFFTLTGNTSA